MFFLYQSQTTKYHKKSSIFPNRGMFLNRKLHSVSQKTVLKETQLQLLEFDGEVQEFHQRVEPFNLRSNSLLRKQCCKLSRRAMLTEEESSLF